MRNDYMRIHVTERYLDNFPCSFATFSPNIAFNQSVTPNAERKETDGYGTLDSSQLSDSAMQTFLISKIVWQTQEDKGGSLDPESAILIE